MTPKPRIAEPVIAYRLACPDDLVLFAEGLDIPSATGRRLFSSCIQSFQREFFRDVAPTIHAVRDGTTPKDRRWWMERTKKAGKDSDLAIILLWLMAFAVRPLLVQVVAANQKQSAIIKRRASVLLHCNPWLNDLVHIQQNKILGKVGEVIIEATGTSGAAQGETPDLLILNELVHVERWSVMETHMNNADGVPSGVVIVSTNAGFKGTKAEKWRKDAMADPGRWKMRVWNRVAPWVNPDDVADAKRRNIGSEYERLWAGRWVSGRGDAVDEASIDRCFRPGLGPLAGPEKGWRYVAALDLGVSHDHAGVSLLGVNESESRIRVGLFRSWEPSILGGGGKLEVDGEAVEKYCLWLSKAFRVEWFGYDPSTGGSFMAQSLIKVGVPMREMSFSVPSNLTLMARAFVLTVKAGRLECYDDEEGRLRRDFGKFDLSDRGMRGFKLEAVSDEYGHADVGTAVVIALPRAVEMLGGFDALSPDEDLSWDMGDEPMTEEELEDMPDDLRGIMDGEDEMEEEWGRKVRAPLDPL